jgi:hypothetical protein
MQCVAWAKLFASEMGRPLKGFSGSALKGWQTGSPFSVEWKRVENTPQAVPKPGDIIFFDATKANPYGHVAVVERADQKMIIVIEQNAGNGNGNGLGMNAITRNTVGYTASGSRGKCLGWYEYVGKPTPAPIPTPTPTPAPEKQEDLSKLGTYERIYREEVKRTGISGVFSDHSGVNTLSEGEIKALVDIGIIRAIERIKTKE